MALARLVLVAALWLTAAVLSALAAAVATSVPSALALRRQVLAAPEAAVRGYCDRPPADAPVGRDPVAAGCRSGLLWRTPRGGWQDVCAEPRPPAPWPPRYYRLTLACRWRLGPLGAAPEPLVVTVLR